MAGRRRYDEFERPDDGDRSAGWVDDIEPDEVWLTPVHRTSMGLGRRGGADRRDRSWRLSRRKQADTDVAVSAATDVAASAAAAATAATARPAPIVDTEHRIAVGRDGHHEFARIGRRGPLRPELLALAAGAVFILAALVKPWANPQTPALIARESASATPVTAGRSAGPSARPAASSSVDVYALIPPYNYRQGQWPPPELRSPDPSSAWASVDWSFLNVLDSHPSWGVAAITLPSQATVAQTASPDIRWVDEIAPWRPSQILVPGGSSTYALAITWPSGIRVDSISFDYLSYDSPRVGVTPVPAAAVATPLPPSTESAPALSPAPTLKPGTTKPGAARTAPPTLAPDAASMVSGAFWIAPSGDLSTPAPESVRTAWQAAPWVWPLGSYRVTLATNAGQMIVALQLRSVG